MADATLETKRCNKCHEIKSLTQFNSSGSIYKGKTYLRGECKACAKVYNSSAQRQVQNKIHNSSTRKKEHNKINKQKPTYKAKQRIYEKNRLQNDPLFRLKKNIRNRTRIALKMKRWYKFEKFNKYIGCSLDELKVHMQQQFTEGMTWDTYGFGQNKWTIDHIIPLSSAANPEEMYKLCHYTNLQPMWYQDNIAKSNKIK